MDRLSVVRDLILAALLLSVGALLAIVGKDQRMGDMLMGGALGFIAPSALRASGATVTNTMKGLAIFAGFAIGGAVAMGCSALQHADVKVGANANVGLDPQGNPDNVGGGVTVEIDPQSIPLEQARDGGAK